jgi:hypothetical protein
VGAASSFESNIVAALISAGLVIFLAVLGVAVQVGAMRQQVKDLDFRLRNLEQRITAIFDLQWGGRRHSDPP